MPCNHTFLFKLFTILEEITYDDEKKPKIETHPEKGTQ
jgi:hypothetical protein